jgi:hypothetical protein
LSFVLIADPFVSMPKNFFFVVTLLALLKRQISLFHMREEIQEFVYDLREW